MSQFNKLSDAYWWCVKHAGECPCTVFVDGRAYSWVHGQGGMTLRPAPRLA